MPTNAKKQLSILGLLIKNLREERNITQSQFAKRLKTTQSAVARIEAGQQNVSAGLLSRISEVLDKNVIEVSNGAINLEIEGGRPLSGSITTKTSKNCAMGLIAASLLNEGETVLENIPRIEEVYRMIEILTSIGVSLRWIENSLVIRPPKKFTLEKINRTSSEKVRSVIMLIGPLIHSLNSFSLPQPGGCKLGRRTVRPHFYALENLGISIKTSKENHTITVHPPKNREIILYESGDTVTENVLMAAARLPGKTVIKYASGNYQVQELCFFLEKLGVTVEGIGTATLTVHGKKEINMSVRFSVSEDPIESMFMIAAAIVTKSHLTITRCPIRFLELELFKLKKMGFKFKVGKIYLARNGKTELTDIETFPSNLTALEEKIHPNVYPGLNIDNLPFFAIIATQAKGQTFLHDWVYEARAIHYKELDKLGADIILVDPHRIYINGPTPLKASEIICPPALRPAAIILIGMLSAEGTSILRNIYSINRGYEDLVKRLVSVGAKIRIV